MLTGSLGPACIGSFVPVVHILVCMPLGLRASIVHMFTSLPLVSHWFP